MSSADFQLLLRHELWANQRIANTILALPEPNEKSVKLINHIIGAQHTWISRITDTPAILTVFPEIDKSEWLSIMEKHSQQLMEIASDEDNLLRVISYSNTLGQSFQNPVKEILFQLILHAQYHRGQIVSYSRELIEKVPPTDMIAFLRL